MIIEITRSAFNDIKIGQEFYNLQKTGLGVYFQDTIFAEIDSLIIYAGVHIIKYGYYRSLARNFPYAIYYKIEDKTIIIVAVLDCRQNPSFIKQRLNK